MEQSKLKVEGCFRFDFQPMGDLICLLLGAAKLLSERSLSFNNVMTTLTSARWGARIVEPASVVGKCVCLGTCTRFDLYC